MAAGVFRLHEIRHMNPLTQPVTPKATIRIVTVLLLSATVLGAAWFGWRKYQSRTLTVAETRKAIRSYLHKQSGVKEFKPTTAEASTNSTSADDESRKQKQKRKREDPPQEKLAGESRRSVGEASDYPTIYRLIGENLARVDLLLTYNTVPQTEAALLLAADACCVALDSGSERLAVCAHRGGLSVAAGGFCGGAREGSPPTRHGSTAGHHGPGIPGGRRNEECRGELPTADCQKRAG